MGVRTIVALSLGVLAFAVGVASGQDKDDLKERFNAVRREIKHLDLDDTLTRLPAFLKREQVYAELLRQLQKAAIGNPDQYKALLEKGRQMKLDTLDELNHILKKHKSQYCGITEQDVWERLKNARFRNVTYGNEWLVNIIDDLEESCEVNIEMDARIYKFDSVTFDFDKTSARAMLQIMGDTLLFNWVVRGDTLYVYKERHEVLFGGEWIRKKRAAWKARKEALKKAAEEAQRRALEGGDEKEDEK